MDKVNISKGYNSLTGECSSELDTPPVSQIIDGVDVSGCPFYQYQTKEDYEMRYPESGDCEIGLAGYLFDYSRITEELDKFCLDNHNCYYKQLKRLEQECEKLKQVTNESIIEQEKLIAKVNELQAENDNLKDDIDKQQLYVDSLEQENERLKEENYGLNQELLGYKKGVQASEIIELKQALQEIREIVSEPCIVDENCQTCNSGCMQKDILDKINEVIGGE